MAILPLVTIPKARHIEFVYKCHLARLLTRFIWENMIFFLLEFILSYLKCPPPQRKKLYIHACGSRKMSIGTQ